MDGRASISVSAAEIVKDLKLNLSEKDKKESLIIERDSKDSLELEYLPLLYFKEIEKQEILAEITSITESNISGWTHEAQKFYLDKFVRALKINNATLKNALENKEIRSHILEMMLCGKYILQYRKVTRNHEKELYYINQFNEKLNFLISQFKDLKLLINAFIEDGGVFRVLPLAYYEIAIHDEMLTEFRASELVGHNVAYKVAKNEDKFKKIIVVNKMGKVLEEYSIHEIKVIKDHKRDRGLKGLILVPINKNEEPIITIYVTWAGTYGSASMNADLERAPGEESYRQGEDQILKEIAVTIEKIGKPVKIVICGHSLGGSLSQLSFHSLQRVIALNTKDEEVNQKVIQLEDDFHKVLNKLSPHQRDLSDIKINPALIREMSVNVWNSAGVLMPVVNHTNKLAPILSQIGIQQFANFGLVDGDVLQAVGQGAILSKVHENGVKIKILKIEYATTKTMVTALGVSAALPAGLTFFGTNPVGWIASVFCMGAILAKVIRDKKQAHTKHHFIQSMRPDYAYSVYNSHQLDGSLNITECKIIHEELTNKSTTFVDAGLQIISDTFMQEERFNSELHKAIVADNKNSSGCTHIMSFLISHIKSNISGEESRLIQLLKEKQGLLPINIQDSLGKTILHYAIENEKFELANALLDIPGVNVNQIDNEKNFPLLSFVQQINTFLPHLLSTYQFGVKLLSMTTVDLSLKNNKDLSIHQIYKSWYWAGYNAKSFTVELSKRLKSIKATMPLKQVDSIDKFVMR